MSEMMAATANPDRYAVQKNAQSDYVAIAKATEKAAISFFSYASYRNPSLFAEFPALWT
jgi:hypothetical protein